MAISLAQRNAASNAASAFPGAPMGPEAVRNLLLAYIAENLFNPASPGSIGGTTPAAGSFTTLANSGLQTTTLAAANTGAWTASGYSLTGSNATGMVNLSGTWNTTGVPTAFNLAITDTASGLLSNLFNFQYTNANPNYVRFRRLTATSNMLAVGGTGVSFRVFEGVETTPRSSSDSSGLRLAANTFVRWSQTSNDALNTIDVGLFRNASGILEVNDGTNAGVFGDIKVRALRVDTAANMGSGTATITTGTSSLAVSNSLVSATSRIFATTQDQLVGVLKVTPGAGTFTIYMDSIVSANTIVQYIILP